MRGNATTTYRYARRDEAFMRLAVETLHVPTPQRDRLGKGEGMVLYATLYATLCGLFVGLRSIQAALARRHVPRGVVTAADLALARARRRCIPRGRRTATRTRGA